jgi:hypothetical protein
VAHSAPSASNGAVDLPCVEKIPDAQLLGGIDLPPSDSYVDYGSWLLTEDFDVDALDFSLLSAISE